MNAKRISCIDALRGFDMLWIIGGGEVLISLRKAAPSAFTANLAGQFEHVWGEFHFFDIIMPLFLFVVGAVMPIAFAKRIKKGARKRDLYMHVLKRVAALYILGLITQGNILEFDIAALKLLTGALHAIAIGYLFSAILLLEVNDTWQVVITSCLLLLYWVMMAFVPVPGQGAGVFTPTGNLALYIDDKVLSHFQEGAGWTYIISSMTFTCSVMLGVFAGKILFSGKKAEEKAIALAVTGVACLLAGKIWGIWLPVIHHLWTSSLVLLAGGWCFLLLAIFFLIMDVWGWQKWAFPFIVLGANSIAVYVATQIFDFKVVANIFVKGLAQWAGTWFSPILALAALILIWLILYWMYRKKTFIKI